MNTELMKRIGISSPIMLAPMGAVAGGELAAAVSNAGGLGMIGAGYGDPDWLQRELTIVSQKTSQPWGVGFITWCLTQEALDLVMRFKPAVLMFSFGDITPWLEQIRLYDVAVFSQVHDLAGAIQAHSLSVDFIVAQGSEAGGHGTGQRSTLSLVRGVKKQRIDTPVIAAGGIADGRSLAAALKLGADGVSMGTRFYASFEALADYRMKERLVECGGDDTIRTQVFDIIRELNWPKGYSGRAITNKFVARWHGDEQNLRRLVKKHQEAYYQAQEKPDPKVAMVWAGESLDSIFNIEEAGKLVRQIHRDAEHHLR